MTKYLDFEKLEAIDPVAFRATKPFPYTNPQRLLTDEGFKALLEKRLTQMERKRTKLFF